MTQRVAELQDELEEERMRYQSETESLMERIRELEALVGTERPHTVIHIAPSQVTSGDAANREDRSDVPAIVP